MKAVEDRGLFWSSETEISDGRIPPSAAPGFLSISETGQIELDLDTILDVGANRDRKLGHARLPSLMLVHGLLKKKGAGVILFGGYRNGHFISSFFPENERYTFDYGIVSPSFFGSFPDRISIREIYISLEGFEDWIASKAIAVSMEEDGSSYTARYTHERDLVFELEDGVLTLFESLPSTFEGRGNSAELRHRVSLKMDFGSSVSPEKAAVFWSQMRDFLILLTNAERSLKQPSVKIVGERYWTEFYSFDAQAGDDDPSDLKCAVRFDEIKGTFGSLFQTWRTNRERHGPGYYLYLGVRRGHKMFVEHRFANMLWGLERLHRSKFITEPNQALSDKIERILACIDKPKDRKWASSMLLNNSEIKLSSRLFTLFSAISLDIEDERLHKFTVEMAHRRNDVSHFGGPRAGVDHKIFLSSMHKTSAVIQFLYHAVILLDIGVPLELIKNWLEKRWSSWQAQRLFEAVNLKDTKEVLQISASPNIEEAL